METIRKPAAWHSESLEDLMDIEAGRAYVLDQLDPKSEAISPEYVFKSDRKNCDSAWYEVYEDGSLWFINNAEDEVWSDYRDFVRDSLLPGIEASINGLCWSQDECDDSDDINSWVIDEMDREILLLYCDNDESDARKMVGCEVA